MAARITEPTVGAWVWASGSQVCNGNIGTLMAKPRNMPPKIKIAVVRVRLPLLAIRYSMGRPRRAPTTPALEEQGDERQQQHERRAEQREEEELERRARPLLAAPDADHEVHRQQDDLEEDEEQDEVLGHELPAMPTCRSRISMRNAFVLPGSGMWFQL